jgi:hypothetical protein
MRVDKEIFCHPFTKPHAHIFLLDFLPPFTYQLPFPNLENPCSQLREICVLRSAPGGGGGGGEEEEEGGGGQKYACRKVVRGIRKLWKLHSHCSDRALKTYFMATEGPTKLIAYSVEHLGGAFSGHKVGLRVIKYVVRAPWWGLQWP